MFQVMKKKKESSEQLELSALQTIIWKVEEILSIVDLDIMDMIV